MKSIHIPQPNPKQVLFLEADAPMVGFGGARGGGKSWVVQVKSILLCLNYAGIKTLIVRRSYPELVNNHINVMRPMLSGIATYNDRDKVLRFHNGSTINFMFCSADRDLDKLQGQQYDCIFLDEATMLTEYQIKAIRATLRGVNDFPKRMYLTANPGNVGHQYFKRIFIDRQYVDGEAPEDHLFIQSLVTDNKALLDADPGYIKQLEALPSKLRDAWLYGRWDVYEGQVFEEWRDDPQHYDDRRMTHVIAPFDPPKNWPITRSFDWGYSRPWSCGWFAVDEDGVAYRILERYGSSGEPNEGARMTPDEVFAEIAAIERQHPWLQGRRITGVADPAIWAADTGVSIAETAAKHGVFFQKGDHERIAGWMQLHYRLAFDEGYPMLYVFSNCKDTIRTLPLLQYDAHKVEDVDSSGEDHIADEMRYFCMTRPIKPRPIVAEKRRGTDPLRDIFDIDPNTLAAPRVVRRMEVYDSVETV